MLHIDYPADSEPINPCPCTGWSVQILLEHPELNGVWVREWHALGCSTLAEFLSVTAGCDER